MISMIAEQVKLAGGQNSRCEMVQQAADPATPDRTLDQLARKRSPAIWAAIAGNPNASEATLARCGARHPEAFLANPILGVWRLLRPTWYETADRRFCLALIETLARRGRASLDEIFPASFRRRFYDKLDSASLIPLCVEPDNELRMLVASQLAGARFLPIRWEEAICQWATDPVREIRSIVASWRCECPMIFISLARDPSPLTAGVVARNPSSAACNAFTFLMLHPSIEVRRAAVERGDFPERMVDPFIEDKAVAVRQAFACRIRYRPHLLARLAEDSAIEVRAAVAANRASSQAVLTRLADDASQQVQLAVLRNPAAAPDLLIKICQGLGDELEQMVLKHRPRLWAPFAEWLADRVSLSTLAALVSDIAAPSGDLEGLLASSDCRVRLALAYRFRRSRFNHVTKRNVSLISALACDPDSAVREAVASDERLSPDQLTVLADDSAPSVRGTVAQLGRCPGKALIKLAADPEPDVRLAAANTAVQLLSYRVARYCLREIEADVYGDAVLNWAQLAPVSEALAMLAKPNVFPFAGLGCLAERALSEPELLVRLARIQRFPHDFSVSLSFRQVCRKSVSKAAVSDNVYLQAAAARHRFCPKSAMRQLASHPHPLVRLQLLRNPCLPPALPVSLAGIPPELLPARSSAPAPLVSAEAS
jgi:hypothetical protein